MKKILLWNRKLIRHMTPTLYIVALVFIVITGASMLAGSWPDIDFSEYPSWYGYLLVYGSFLLLVSFVIDFLYNIFLSSKGIFKLRKSGRKTLLQRIEEAEKS